MPSKGTPASRRPLDLLHQPPGHHLVHPLVDALVEDLPVPVGQGDGHLLVAGREGLGLPVVLGDGLAGGVPHLQGTEDPLLVVGVELGRRFGVHLLQLLPQHCQSLGLDPGLEGLAQAAGRLEVGIGAALAQAVDVQPCAPHQDGLLAPAEDILHPGRGLLDVPGHTVVFSGIHHPHHVVGDPRHLLRRGPGGADGHVPVDLHGVGGDHLSPQPLGQGHPQFGLSCGGGAADDDEFWRHGAPPFLRDSWWASILPRFSRHVHERTMN